MTVTPSRIRPPVPGPDQHSPVQTGPAERFAARSVKSPVRTFGVEEEVLLVDASGTRLVAAAEDVVRAAQEAAAHSAGPAQDQGVHKLTLEVKQEQIEIVGPPQSRLDELAASIRAGRAMADAAASQVGARTVALATSPLGPEPHLVATPRFRRMQDKFGLTLTEQLTCGFHVHVGIESDEEGVAVLDRIRAWLPLVIALSANSPFWHGTDSGYSSYRYQAWRRWPTAGPMDLFGSPAEYHRQVADLLGSGVPMDNGMIYFDARLSKRFPTVEIRVADVCLDPLHAAGVAGVVRALVETASRQWRSGRAPHPATATQLQLWSWQASRSGVEGGELVDPVTGRPCPAGDAVARLLDLIRPVLAEWQEETMVDTVVGSILRDGSGAVRQRKAYGRRGDFADVIRDAMEPDLSQ